MARRSPAARLSHVGADGRARMVDVSLKPPLAREAIARGRITLSPAAARLVQAGAGPKGPVVEVARLAAVMAAKRTADLIPLCHPVPLSHVDVQIHPRRNGFVITASARTTAQTGVEMEALTAVAVAALTLYDMVKAVDTSMVMGEIRLVSKRKTRPAG
jgi:cyclic pyranopterin phosphate synthase